MKTVRKIGEVVLCGLGLLFVIYMSGTDIGFLFKGW